MKYCKMCDTTRDNDLFYSNKSSKDGLAFYCKFCFASIRITRHSYQMFYREANREKLKKQELSRYYSNREAIREKIKNNYLPHPRVREPLEVTKQKRKNWKRANSGRVNESSARRYAAKTNATPIWADRNAIIAIYNKAAAMRANGQDVHVDHIIPLRGKNVSGLHVADNLRIISAFENMSKGNRLMIE